MSRDWHFARDEYIAVHLSEAQWSSFVSSFNVGGGTPCTIDYVRGEGHKPYLPDRPITPIFKNEVDKKLGATIGHVKDTIKVIKENTANLSKAKQANILASLETTLRELESNLPFVSEQFGEHMETVVEKAKSEVNAYAMNTIVRLGLDVLKDHKTPEIELHTKKDE